MRKIYGEGEEIFKSKTEERNRDVKSRKKVKEVKSKRKKGK